MENESMKVSRKIGVIAIIIMLCATSFIIGANATNGTSGNGSIIESGSMTTDSVYTIFKDSTGMIFAKNGTTGAIDFKNMDASTIFQLVANNADHGKIYVKNSSYDLNTPIICKIGQNWVSDGAYIDIMTLDATAFTFGLDSQYTPEHNTGMNGFIFLGNNLPHQSCINITNNKRSIIIEDIRMLSVHNGIEVRGGAFDATIRDCQNSYSDGICFKVTSYTLNGNNYPPTNVVIDHCENTGTHALGQIGVKISGIGASGISTSIKNCWFEGLEKDIVIDNEDDVNIQGNSISSYNGSIGISVLNANGCIISGNSITSTGTNTVGIYVDSSSSIVINNNFFRYVDGKGIYFHSDPSGGTISNNVVTMNNNKSKFVDGLLSLCTISGNNFYSSTQKTSIGFNITGNLNSFTGNVFNRMYCCISDNGTEINIVGNTFSASDYGILLVRSGNIIGNRFYSCYIQNYIVSTSVLIQSNNGQLTFNTGFNAVITVGATSIIVNHGLSGTPKSITFSPRNNVDVFTYISGVNATSFTLNIPSANGQEIRYYWMASL